MMITYKKIALYYLLLSFFFGIISGILNGLSIVLFGDIFIIALVFVTLFTKKLHRGSTPIVVLIILALVGMSGVFRYGFNIDIIGLFFRSRIIFVLLVTIFFYIYSFSNLDNNKLMKVDLFIENVIKLNIVVILVEGIAINYFDLQPYLKQVFGMGYYDNSPNPIFVDFVPNGLVFGRQNASIISVIGVLWWFPWFQDWKRSLGKYIWLFASVTSWAFTITTTSILCFIIPLLFIAYSGLAVKRRLTLMILSSMLVFGVVSYYESILWMRYSSSIELHGGVENFVELYYDAFLEPMNPIKRAPLEFLLGTGHLASIDEIQYSIIRMNTVSTELGFLLVAIKHGAVLVGIVFASFLIYIFKFLRFVRKSIIGNAEQYKILRYVCVTLAIVVSLFHYTSIFQPGIIQLLATTIALPYVIRKNSDHFQIKIMRLKS